MLFVDGIADVELVMMDKCLRIAVAQCLVSAVVASWRQIVRQAAAQDDGLVEHRSVATDQ